MKNDATRVRLLQSLRELVRSPDIDDFGRAFVALKASLAGSGVDPELRHAFTTLETAIGQRMAIRYDELELRAGTVTVH